MTGKMQCFSYLQTVDEKSFFEEKNVEKCHFSYSYFYRSATVVLLYPGTGKTCSLHVTPSVEITPKIRKTRIKRRTFRADFVGYFDVPDG